MGDKKPSPHSCANNKDALGCVSEPGLKYPISYACSSDLSALTIGELFSCYREKESMENRLRQISDDVKLVFGKVCVKIGEGRFEEIELAAAKWLEVEEMQKDLESVKQRLEVAEVENLKLKEKIARQKRKKQNVRESVKELEKKLTAFKKDSVLFEGKNDHVYPLILEKIKNSPSKAWKICEGKEGVVFACLMNQDPEYFPSIQSAKRALGVPDVIGITNASRVWQRNEHDTDLVQRVVRSMQ